MSNEQSIVIYQNDKDNAQVEGGHNVLRQIEHFNLDTIISVGSRINSK
ncbi:MAG: hypothetical protein N4A31_06145 [Rickettsiales bacterium]|jgi:hypothetical protein|nr:hypothetical protein [Rickettsiales bacterium]